MKTPISLQSNVYKLIVIYLHKAHCTLVCNSISSQKNRNDDNQIKINISPALFCLSQNHSIVKPLRSHRWCIYRHFFYYILSSFCLNSVSTNGSSQCIINKIVWNRKFRPGIKKIYIFVLNALYYMGIVFRWFYFVPKKKKKRKTHWIHDWR